MESKWRTLKLALGMKMCLFVPKTLEQSPPESGERLSDAVFVSPSLPPHRSTNGYLDMPATPVPSSSGLRLPNYSSKSSKSTCAICLNTMKPGQGHAIFTAECSHVFHFQCITLNVKHGNDMCPVCRAKWKEIPFQSPTVDLTRRRSRTSHLSSSQVVDPWTTMVRRLPRRVNTSRSISSSLNAAEPDVFNDDELVDHQPEPLHRCCNGAVEVKAYTEIPAVSRLDFYRDFTVLIHLKAPHRDESRAPVDLVTVLDVSGSMAGTKLSLLKRAMGFVIQNLRPYDRLSVIAFSSTSRRLFPLRKMSENGKKEALLAVNSLTSNGGTNISEALKKGGKVMSDRKSKNPVSSIILLSDGQDTYYNIRTDNQSLLLPPSLNHGHSSGSLIPVHTFGFGADHDAVSMHSISEASGGTFSFIETETVIQDAFAQCIGGLLSVVVQELVLHVECVHPNLQLSSIKAGSYKNSMNSTRRIGVIEVGDLYADEERDFLVNLDVVPSDDDDETSILNVKCVYNDPISKKLMTFDRAADAKIRRPETTGPMAASMEVDKQQNRIQTAEAMSEAKIAADNGDLAAAVSILDNCRMKLAESVSLKAGDRLCAALDSELFEMQERMANKQIYETSGRAYILSGLSSHSWQRATTRGGDSIVGGTSLVNAYQTPSMVDMVNRSQTMSLTTLPRSNGHFGRHRNQYDAH